jgi:hypothetical protein
MRYITEEHSAYQKILACEQYLISQGVSIQGAYITIRTKEISKNLIIGNNIFNSNCFPRELEDNFYLIED